MLEGFSRYSGPEGRRQKTVDFQKVNEFMWIFVELF